MWSPTTLLSIRVKPKSAMPHMALSLFPDDARPEGTSPREIVSRFAENALDLVDGSPVDLGDLDNRHAIFYPAADARELRSRNVARRLRLGADRNFGLLVTAWSRRRDYSQHTRFARRLVGWWGVRN